MPGYTKQELVAKGASLRSFAWCRKCRRYWSKRGFKKHFESDHEKIVVKIDMPPMPKLKKGDIAIIHPAVQQLLDFVADQIVKDLIAEHAARLRGESLPTGDAVQRSVEPAEAEEEYKKPEYEIISVDDAAKRFGTTRDAIMARFQQVTDEYYSLSKRSRAKLHARVRSAESAGAPTNQASPKRRRTAPR
jgi:hypothetical protein